jgi:hypothetical protein
MTMQSATGHGAALPLWKAALVGALVFAAACLLFWATAAARALPVDSPALIRSFTPAAGIGRLVTGLFWTALFGATLALLAAGAWNATHRPRHG